MLTTLITLTMIYIVTLIAHDLMLEAIYRDALDEPKPHK